MVEFDFEVLKQKRRTLLKEASYAVSAEREGLSKTFRVRVGEII